MDAKKVRKPNWDDASMQVLCDGVERRILTIKGKFSPSLTQEKKQAAWSAVTACVNAVTFGCQRTVEEVKKRWQDAQCAVKRKEAMRLKQATATGGGPAPDIFWKCWEKIVLRTLSPTAISGIEGGVDTAATQLLESSMQCEEQAATPCDNGNIEIATVTCNVSCAEEAGVSCTVGTTPEPGESNARKMKKKDHAEPKLQSCKRRSELDLPSELLKLKRQKLEQERTFQDQIILIEREKVKSLQDIKEILNCINDKINPPSQRSPLSVSPVIKFH